MNLSTTIAQKTLWPEKRENTPILCTRLGHTCSSFPRPIHCVHYSFVFFVSASMCGCNSHNGHCKSSQSNFGDPCYCDMSFISTNFKQSLPEEYKQSEQKINNEKNKYFIHYPQIHNNTYVTATDASPAPYDSAIRESDVFDLLSHLCGINWWL